MVCSDSAWQLTCEAGENAGSPSKQQARFIMNRPKKAISLVTSGIAVAFLINFGKQYVLSNAMSVDWHVGIGYGISSGGTEEYNFGFINGPKESPLALSAGFTIGFLGK